MAAHVKSIDNNHLLEIGLEGFYGGTTPEKKHYNPSNLEYGSDFIANNLIPEIDFASIHIYAEQWYVLFPCIYKTNVAYSIINKWYIKLYI